MAWRWRRNLGGALWSNWRGIDDGGTQISLEAVRAGNNVIEYAYASPPPVSAESKK